MVIEEDVLLIAAAWPPLISKHKKMTGRSRLESDEFYIHHCSIKKLIVSTNRVTFCKFLRHQEMLSTKCFATFDHRHASCRKNYAAGRRKLIPIGYWSTEAGVSLQIRLDFLKKCSDMSIQSYETAFFGFILYFGSECWCIGAWETVLGKNVPSHCLIAKWSFWNLVTGANLYSWGLESVGPEISWAGIPQPCHLKGTCLDKPIGVRASCRDWRRRAPDSSRATAQSSSNTGSFRSLVLWRWQDSDMGQFQTWCL